MYSWVKTSLLAIGGVAIATVIFVYSPYSRPVFTWMFPVGKIPHIEFDILRPPKTPNHFLLCPKDYCVFGADAEAPVYNMSEQQLIDVFFEALELNPNMTVVKNYNHVDQFDILERSRYFAFPDLLTVRFFKRGENKSTLAMYSRSLYGHYDFGVNRKRVEKLLRTIHP